MTHRQMRAWVVLAFAIILLAVYGLRWAQTDHTLIGSTDFSATYVGGSLWHDGHRADLYSDSAQLATRHARIHAPDPLRRLPFVNPPLSAVIAAPVTLLGLDAAYRLWSVGQFALLVIALAMVVRCAPWPRATDALTKVSISALALAGMATLQFVVMGQWDGVLALGLALAYRCWRRGRPATGALLLGLTAAIAKPHLAIGLAAFLLGWSERRALAGAALGLALAVGASVLAVGTSGMNGFAHAVLGDPTLASNQIGLNGLFGSWFGNGVMTLALGATGSLAAVGVCVAIGRAIRGRPERLEPALAGALALSLVAAPHLLVHDLVLLAPALVWTMAWGLNGGDGARSRIGVAVGLWVLVNVAGAMDFGGYLSTPPGRLTPWVLLLSGAAAVLVLFRSGSTRVARGVPRRARQLGRARL